MHFLPSTKKHFRALLQPAIRSRASDGNNCAVHALKSADIDVELFDAPRRVAGAAHVVRWTASDVRKAAADQGSMP